VRRICAATVALLLAACSGEPGPGGIGATVDYHLAAAGGCVTVSASPAMPVGLTKQSGLSLLGKPLEGTLHIGVLESTDWTGAVTVVAALRRPTCSSPVEISQSQTATPEKGKVTALSFTLDETAVPVADGGKDGGAADAGRFDAGTTDAGMSDGGTFDGGTTDAGTTDAGTLDGGPLDGGTLDAGTDAGSTDAGSTDGGTLDAGTFDAGTFDAGTFDAGTFDAGTFDAGTFDAGTFDAGDSDAGTFDAGTFDAGDSDAGTFDAGTFDAGDSDAGTFDAGTFDAGDSDAGTFDAGDSDAGTFDAGDSDAGTFDAGTFDAGTFDAGTFDAGDSDAGSSDAGPLVCSFDGGFVQRAAPNFNWRDVAPYGTDNSAWLAGDGELVQYRPDAGFLSGGPSCFADLYSVVSRADGRAYAGLDGGVLVRDANVCTALPVDADIGTVHELFALEDAGTTLLYGATNTATLFRTLDPDVPALRHRWDFGDAGLSQLWSVQGADEATLFAAGAESNGKGAILKYRPSTDDWALEPLANTGVVIELSVVNPTLAFAGTDDSDLFMWDGATWTRVSNNGFGPIYGLKAFGPNRVYAVGPGGRVGEWDGTSWRVLDTFDAGAGGWLARIRGRNACELWSVGTNGLVITSP
jgi:hypothetical protein